MNAPEQDPIVTIWNAVIEKCSNSGREALTPHELTVFLVNVFLVDLENSGRSGALYNSTGRLVAVGDAFAAVGAPSAAAILRDAAALLDSPVASQASTWSECLRVTTVDQHLPRWDHQLSEAVEELYQALEFFTAAHAIELLGSTGAA